MASFHTSVLWQAWNYFDRLLKKSFSHKARFHHADLKIKMDNDEKSLFEKYIQPSKFYLEFGCGGSSIQALRQSNAIIHSVESDREWVREMKRLWYVKFQLLRRLSIHYSNIGPTRKWGNPKTMKYRNRFPAYSAGVFKKINPQKIDLVLIDGRFRVACVLQTIINCSGNKGLRIMIHDFYNRPQYHIVLKYLTEIEKAGNLGVFAIQPHISPRDVISDYKSYQFIPA
jgi:hypothetical protein